MKSYAKKPGGWTHYEIFENRACPSYIGRSCACHTSLHYEIPIQEADENFVNNSSNDTAQFTGSNDTDNTSVDPVSIPLEKPPFID